MTHTFFQLTQARLQVLAMTEVGFWSLLGHPRGIPPPASSCPAFCLWCRVSPPATHTHTSLRGQEGIFLAIFMQKWKSQSDGSGGRTQWGARIHTWVSRPHWGGHHPLAPCLPEKVPLCEHELRASTCALLCSPNVPLTRRWALKGRSLVDYFKKTDRGRKWRALTEREIRSRETFFKTVQTAA